MSCDCFAQESDDPDIREKNVSELQTIYKRTNATQAIGYVHDTIDSYTQSVLKDTRQRLIDQRDSQRKEDGTFDSSIVVFPAPFDVNKAKDTKVPLNIDQKKYEICQTDEYYGDLGFFDELCYFGKYSDGVLGSSFDENADPPDKTSWEDIKPARQYFTGMIAKPVYNVDDVTRLQLNDASSQAVKDLLATRQLNAWEEVQISNLGNKNQILSALLGDSFDGDHHDMWCTLIAFCGYGAHRTTPYRKDQKHPEAYFVNDVTWLADYEVRTGYEKYGAAAYFDNRYHLKEIFLSHSGQTFRPPTDSSSNANRAQWLHAKWAWKVSVSVATFLVDQLAHSYFRESQGLIQAMRNTLSPNHPIRRLMLPFTLGTVYTSRVFNEYLREKGLYHRAFAFKYAELQRLLRDSMEDAPQEKKRQPNEMMRYRFKLLKKKFSVLKNLPDAVYPVRVDFTDHFVQALAFVADYINLFYAGGNDDDTALAADVEASTFYAELQEKLKINSRYRFKKFNMINILGHFMCHATVWNHHCYTAVSFEYSVDPDFTGLKIVGNNANQNNVLNYVEYCAVVLSKGYRFNNLMLPQNGWKVVLAQPMKMSDDEKKKKAEEYFAQYFGPSGFLEGIKTKINKRNNSDRITPYNAAYPPYSQSSLTL